jgi:hypothetical protein
MHVHKGYQPVICDGVPNLAYSEDPSSEYNIYWEEQFNRCLNGYKPSGYRHIPGRLYFYLNFCKIKMADDKLGREIISHPYYRDLEHEFSELIEDCKSKVDNKGKIIKNAEGIIVPKARDKGFTYDTSLLIGLYEAIFYEGNEVGFGSGSPDEMSKIKNILSFAHSELPPELQHMRVRANNDMWQFGYKSGEVNEKGKDSEKLIKGIRSILYFRDSFNTKIDAFNALRLSFGIIDECGLVNRLKQIHIKNQACYQRGSFQFGVPIYGGTAKSFDSKDHDYEELWEASKDFNLRRFFIPDTKAYHGFINYETGKSDEVGALENILSQFYKPVMGDKQALARVQQEHPTEPSHCWRRKSGGLLPVEIIEDQLKFIKEHKHYNIKTGELSEIEIGRLEWTKGFGTGVEWISDSMGKIKRYAEPVIDEKSGEFMYKNLDVGGVDSYTKEDTITTDSLGSVHIYRRFVGLQMECMMPVIEYVERPTHTIVRFGKKLTGKDIFYDNIWKLSVYYGSKMLVEDTDEQLFSRFNEWGATQCLALRPQKVINVNSEIIKKFGTPMNESVKVLLTDLIEQQLRSNPQSIFFSKLLTELKRWGVGNCDRVISFGLCLLYDADLNARKIVAKVNKYEEKKVLEFGSSWERNSYGLLVERKEDNYLPN